MLINTLKEEKVLIPLKIILVYVIWKIFAAAVSYPSCFLHSSWNHFVLYLGAVYAHATSFLLNQIGLQAVAEGININLLQSQKQIWVQDHCLAIPATVVFCGAVVSFKGSWNSKWKFMLIGLVGIVLINLLRLVFVSLAWVYLSDYFFHLHHSFIYVLITYGFIFWMLTRWMKQAMKSPFQGQEIKL